MKNCFFILFILLAGCGDKEVQNKVDYRQINSDNSNNYRYIFKDEIKKDKKNRKRIQNEFKWNKKNVKSYFVFIFIN